MPGYPFVPMLLGQTALPFDDENYSFEIKYDGVRMTARITADGAELFNRRLHKRTRQYPEIAEQLKGFAFAAGQGGGAAVFDGEIIALSPGGLPDFYRVMRRDRVEDPPKSLIREVPVYYMVFDITEYGGSPLYDTEYSLRREVLESVFSDASAFQGKAKGKGKTGGVETAPNIKLVDALRENGVALFEAARAEGLEGIVAKRLDSPYGINVRSNTWLKIKAGEYKRP